MQTMTIDDNVGQRLIDMFADAEAQRAIYDARLNKRIAELRTALDANEATVRDLQEAQMVLVHMIDATENGDMVREDMYQSPAIQRSLLHIHDQILLEHQAISRVL